MRRKSSSPADRSALRHTYSRLGCGCRGWWCRTLVAVSGSRGCAVSRCRVDRDFIIAARPHPRSRRRETARPRDPETMLTLILLAAAATQPAPPPPPAELSTIVIPIHTSLAPLLPQLEAQVPKNLARL